MKNHIHYKVMATKDFSLERIQALLAAERARVVGVSRLFNFVAADDLPDDLRARLSALGAEVALDVAYAPD